MLLTFLTWLSTPVVFSETQEASPSLSLKSLSIGSSTVMVLFSSGTSVGVKSIVSVLVSVAVAFVAAVVSESPVASVPVATELVFSVVSVTPPQCVRRIWSCWCFSFFTTCATTISYTTAAITATRTPDVRVHARHLLTGQVETENCKP